MQAEKDGERGEMPDRIRRNGRRKADTIRLEKKKEGDAGWNPAEWTEKGGYNPPGMDITLRGFRTAEENKQIINSEVLLELCARGWPSDSRTKHKTSKKWKTKLI